MSIKALSVDPNRRSALHPCAQAPAPRELANFKSGNQRNKRLISSFLMPNAEENDEPYPRPGISSGKKRDNLVRERGRHRAFALANNIDLLDIDALLAVIMKRSAEQQNALLAVALEGEYWRPTCASCGVKMVERERRTDGRPFWGCVNYPRCSTRIGMRER